MSMAAVQSWVEEARPATGRPVAMSIAGGAQAALLDDIRSFAGANAMTCSINRNGKGEDPFVVFTLKAPGVEVLGSNPMSRDCFSIFLCGPGDTSAIRARLLRHLSPRTYVRRLR